MPSAGPWSSAVDVKVTDDELIVQLEDGRTLAAPLVWYPRLLHGSKRERARWRFIGRGVGIHWPALDEDISVEGLLAGRRSGESQKSLKRWFERHRSARPDKRKHPEFLDLIERARAEFSAGRTISMDEMKHRVLPKRVPNNRVQPKARKARRVGG